MQDVEHQPSPYKRHKGREEDRFEPIPLYIPQFEMPPYDDRDEEKAKDRQNSERGVWITKI